MGEEQNKAIQALLHQIESTKEQSRSQELQTINTIEQLENSFAASEQENKSLRQKLEEKIVVSEQEITSLKENLDGAKTNCDELQIRHDTLCSNDDQIIRQW